MDAGDMAVRSGLSSGNLQAMRESHPDYVQPTGIELAAQLRAEQDAATASEIQRLQDELRLRNQQYGQSENEKGHSDDSAHASSFFLRSVILPGGRDVVRRFGSRRGRCRVASGFFDSGGRW